MVGRVALFLAAFVTLSAACHAGTDETEEMPARNPSPEALDACRALHPDQPDAIESCLEAVRGYPDPGLPPTS